MLQKKCHYEIENYWRTYRKKGEINEIHPNAGRPDAQLLAPPRTNTKGLLFKPGCNTIYKWYARH
jgi:hypothetical protein